MFAELVVQRFKAIEKRAIECQAIDCPARADRERGRDLAQGRGEVLCLLRDIDAGATDGIMHAIRFGGQFQENPADLLPADESVVRPFELNLKSQFGFRRFGDP